MASPFRLPNRPFSAKHFRSTPPRSLKWLKHLTKISHSFFPDKRSFFLSQTVVPLFYEFSFFSHKKEERVPFPPSVEDQPSRLLWATPFSKFGRISDPPQKKSSFFLFPFCYKVLFGLPVSPLALFNLHTPPHFTSP